MINDDIRFGYKSPIKQIAKHCAYTGQAFTPQNPATFEHIKPHCENSSNGIENCLAVTAEVNQKRDNIPFDKWLKRKESTAEHIQDYLDEMRGTKIDGVDYVEEVKKTLNREARGVVSFHGERLDIKG